MEYIHYGINQNDFNISLLKKAQNQPYAIKISEMPQMKGLAMYVNKPLQGTGFWASRKNATNGWKEWCISEDFNTESLKSYTIFELTDNARVYIVNNKQDVDYLKQKYSLPNEAGIDFTKLNQDYDAIDVTTMDNGVYHALYLWDCESILILNPEIIIIKGENNGNVIKK
jgi:hypothetical protein